MSYITEEDIKTSFFRPEMDVEQMALKFSEAISRQEKCGNFFDFFKILRSCAICGRNRELKRFLLIKK